MAAPPTFLKVIARDSGDTLVTGVTHKHCFAKPKKVRVRQAVVF
jgi:hypothetical protein